MNLKEGTRRLALLLGVVGAILGGFASYVELQTSLAQRTRHMKFERLATSAAVKQERDRRFPPPARLDMDSAEPIAGPHNPKSESGYAAWPSEVDKEGVKSIYWSNDLSVNSMETQDGQTLYPTPAPAWWSYALVVIFPFIGFIVPWGVVRAIGWVGAGFVHPPK